MKRKGDRERGKTQSWRIRFKAWLSKAGQWLWKLMEETGKSYQDYPLGGPYYFLTW